MKSLLTISDAELASLEARERFGVVPAIGVAASSAVLAFGGMAMRFSPGDAVPVSGMDHPVGQLILSGMLAGFMLLAAAVIRGVFMKRLQWTVLIALLVHAIICITLNTVTVPSPLLAMEAPGEAPMEELTLPDYGGMEAVTQDTPQWEQPTELDLPETEQHERSEQELDLPAEPEQVQPERRVEQASTPDRRQTPTPPDQRNEPEIEKHSRTPDPRAPQQVNTPQVQTPDVQQPTHEARETDRMAEQLENMQRQRVTVERQSTPRVNPAAVARRSDFRPQDVLRVEIERQQRQAAESRLEAAAARADADSADVAAASSRPTLSTEARSLTQQRQFDTSLPTAAANDAAAPSSARGMTVNRTTVARANAATPHSSAAPTGGESTSLTRNQASAGGAAGAAPQVSVAAAGSSGAPSIAESRAAVGSRRRSDSASQLGSNMGRQGGGSSAPSSRLSASGLTASGSRLARSGRSSGPSMGDVIGRDATGAAGSGQRYGDPTAGGRQRPGAASGSIGRVAVQQAGSAAGSGQLAGPSGASGVGRSGSSLPASGGGLSAGGPAGTTGSRLSGTSGMATGPRRGQLAGRSSGGNARLGAAAGGGSAGSITGTGRRAALAGLPNGSLRAEAAGELVTAGPQGESGGSGRSSRSGAAGGGVSRLLAGPAGGSVGRRRSGLPLGGGQPSSGSGVGRRNTSLGAARSTGLGARRSAGGSTRPSISSSRQIASMIERRVPGISPIPARRLSATFSMRTPEGRAEAVAQLGGSEASEAAVERGLQWLAAHQFAAGNWSIHDYNCVDHRCEHRGSYRADSAATGLALLAFLGAGNTHQTGPHRDVVARGLNWLTERQASNGDLFGEQTEFCWLYSHGMATIALCEAYGMTKDRRLKEPAQRAVNFIVNAQHPEFGGWRYRPQFESDTSVSGWQLMALKSAQIAGLDVPPSAWQGVAHWLDTVEQSDAPGRFTYHPTKQPTPTMTAEGLLMRQYLGASRTDSSLLAGAAFLRQRTPRGDARDVYYWYYGTQVMFHLQGEHWSEWNASLRDMLVDSQDKAGHDLGSWSPVLPDKDAWGESGGRHYVTCLNLLMLEVYYRHLPLYLDLGER